jgi:G:T/U-mismatch repair DNA glycosylase
MNQKKENHPWNWYLPSGAKTIIIGTFPPVVRNWSYNFFYPNKNNYFWKIMAEIANRELDCFSGDEAVKERKEILKQLQTGLSDMGKIIRRTKDSSLDENLEIVEYMDIFQILEENPFVNKIIFTSSSGKSSAIKWFKDYLSGKGIDYKIPKGQRPLKSQVNMSGKIIDVVLLYSTSPRAGASISYKKLVELFKNEINAGESASLSIVSNLQGKNTKK